MSPMVFDGKKQGYMDVSQEYGRILTAAVISSQFRQLLLTNPGKAISAGFGGEAFHLDVEDRNRLASIRATSLADFASQLNTTPRSSSMGYSAAIGD